MFFCLNWANILFMAEFNKLKSHIYVSSFGYIVLILLEIFYLKYSKRGFSKEQKIESQNEAKWKDQKTWKSFYWQEWFIIKSITGVVTLVTTLWPQSVSNHSVFQIV